MAGPRSFSATAPSHKHEEAEERLRKQGCIGGVRIRCGLIGLGAGLEMQREPLPFRRKGWQGTEDQGEKAELQGGERGQRKDLRGESKVDARRVYGAKMERSRGLYREAYDPEILAIVRGVHFLASKQQSGRNFTIFTDSQAAMSRVQPDAPAQVGTRLSESSSWLQESTTKAMPQRLDGYLDIKGPQTVKSQTPTRRRWRRTKSLITRARSQWRGSVSPSSKGERQRNRHGNGGNTMWSTINGREPSSFRAPIPSLGWGRPSGPPRRPSSGVSTSSLVETR